MTRLSSGLHLWFRFGAPLSYLISIAMVNVVAPQMIRPVAIVVILTAVYAIWYGWRLSDVWLDGDALEIKGLASFRLPFSNVTRLDITTRPRGPTIFVLELDQPIKRVQKVRFIPAAGIEHDLRARIHAAQAARTP